MKLIEVEYTDGSEWKTTKTTKLCKALKRIFGKNACIVEDSLDCYIRHVSGRDKFYNVVKRTNNSSSRRYGCIVGNIYIGGYDGDTFPKDFFEEE